jgi:hypothetical protein
MNATTQTDTIRLSSDSMIHTPGIIAMAINQYSFNKSWSIKLLTSGYMLTKRCAVDLLTGKVKHEIIDDAVVFEYPAGKAIQDGGAK